MSTLTYKELGDLTFAISQTSYDQVVAHHIRALRALVQVVATKEPGLYERRQPETWRNCVMREVAILQALPQQREWLQSKGFPF